MALNLLLYYWFWQTKRQSTLICLEIVPLFYSQLNPIADGGEGVVVLCAHNSVTVIFY
jgi:hypothetical protein